MRGAIWRHGPHQAAQQSSSTGRAPASSTFSAKSTSETSSGFAGAGRPWRDSPHRPHTGWTPGPRSSTRFFAPQLVQVTIAIASVVVMLMLMLMLLLRSGDEHEQEHEYEHDGCGYFAVNR